MSDPIVIVSAARTPMGSFQGDFSPLAAHDLGVGVPTSATTEDLWAATVDIVARGSELRRRAGASFRARFTAPTWCDAIAAVYDGTAARPRVEEVPLSA